MESCDMPEPTKFEVKFIGLSISAEGALGIVAAVVVFFGAIAFYKYL
jgi:hypothetical protein